MSLLVASRVTADFNFRLYHLSSSQRDSKGALWCCVASCAPLFVCALLCFPPAVPFSAHNRFFLPWAVYYRPLAFPPTFNICCLRFSAVGGSTRSFDARSWSNPKPFSASNTTPGPTARPLGVPLAALVPSDPETFQNTSHFHPVTQHNGFLEKVCYNSFFVIVAVVLCYRDAPRGCLRTSQRFGR